VYETLEPNPYAAEWGEQPYGSEMLAEEPMMAEEQWIEQEVEAELMGEEGPEAQEEEAL
jgi:hypothetical protein